MNSNSYLDFHDDDDADIGIFRVTFIFAPNCRKFAVSLSASSGKQSNTPGQTPHGQMSPFTDSSCQKPPPLGHMPLSGQTPPFR